MDGNTQVTPDVETIQPSRTPLTAHLRNPRVRLGLIAGLILLVLLLTCPFPRTALLMYPHPTRGSRRT
jgi:hypothetical protein